MRDRRKHVLDSASDTMGRFLYYDRKEDERLPRGAIEESIIAEEVTVDEIVALFRDELTKAVSRERRRA